MAKRSVAEKAKTHEKILRHASRAFRARGSTVGIGDLMKDLGLTNGGFYKHFASKDHLFVDAVVESLRQSGDRFEAIAERSPKNKRTEAIITAYLSKEHLLHPESWCTLAAMAPDIARQPVAVRKKIDGALMLYMQRIARYMPGDTEQEQRKNFILLFSGMSGALAMARAFGDSGIRDKVLAMTQNYYLKTFLGDSDAS
jgi:TetR/AcrR family transcriptional repressor of nem operon